jgi:hypothetical protein
MAVRAGHREDLDEIEKRLEELRRRFDMYFQGSPEQRMPPTSNQAAFGGELRRMREDEIRNWNTQDKFRFNQLFARFVSLDRMWARTLKQIEDGTHKRDKFKVQQMKAKAQQPADTQVGKRPDSLDGMDVDVGSFDDDMINSQPPQKPVSGEKSVPRPVTVPPPSRVPAPVNTGGGGGGGGGGGMSDQRLQQLYDVYMKAKQRTGEQSSLTVDALKKQIEKQIPAIKAKHKCENVDFKVVLKDGKAMLKAVPK